MIKRFVFSMLTVVMCFTSPLKASTDTVMHRQSGLRVSLLTCGVGEEIYEIFGHTAVRIVDSNIEGPLGDVVYNYGMFNGYDEGFELKFMQGKLLYYVATQLYSDFMEEYLQQGRKVEEQLLMLEESKKEELNEFLKNNVLPENRFYKYDFFFDNCATRIRDMFPNSLGKGFVYAEILPQGHHLTFRDIINQYFYRKHWERVGVNILLGSRIDKVMTTSDIMFLPDYLRDGLASATLNGRKIATPPQMVLNGSEHKPSGVNQPMVLMWTLLALTILGFTVKKLHILGRIMSALLLVVTGLLGVLILTMWFATNHQGCGNNFNILWAVPINLFIAFANPKGKGKYAIIAMVLILVSLLLHVVHVQGLVPEFFPLLLALLLVHGMIYKQTKLKTHDGTQK
jgi:hypothetical protein